MMIPTLNYNAAILAICTFLCFPLLGCGDGGGTGTLTVLLQAEDTITDGLASGMEGENIQDGWNVTFDKYIVAIGDIDVHLSKEEKVDAENEEVFVVDLAKVPADGLSLWTLEDLEEGSWEFHYSTTAASDGATHHDSVSQDDYDQMVDNGWTYFVDGTLSKEGGVGESCPPGDHPPVGGVDGDATLNDNVKGDDEDPCYEATNIRFTFGVTADTTFGPCGIDGKSGVSIVADETRTVAATIHGDHLFFNGFPEGDEGGIQRLAQWLADSDLNVDHTVTAQELETINISNLVEIDNERYQLGGSPIIPLSNMLIYVRAQLKTQGHFQGEGECQVDGAGDDHDHDH